MRLQGPKRDVLELDPDDETEQVLAFLTKEQQRGQERMIILVPEDAAAFQTLMDFQAMKKMTKEYPMQVGFVSARKSNTAVLARNRKFPVSETLEEFQQTGWETASAFPIATAALPMDDFSSSTNDNLENVWAMHKTSDLLLNESDNELVHSGRIRHSLPLASALVGAWASVKTKMTAAPRLVEQSRSRLEAISGSIFAGNSRSRRTGERAPHAQAQDPYTPMLANRGGALAHYGGLLGDEDISLLGPEINHEPLEPEAKPRQPILLYSGVAGVAILLVGTLIATLLTLYKNPVITAPASVTIAITPATKVLTPTINLLALPDSSTRNVAQHQIGYRQLNPLDATGTYTLQGNDETSRLKLRAIAVADLKKQLAARVKSNLAPGELWLNFSDSYHTVSEYYRNSDSVWQLTMTVEENPKVLLKAQLKSVLQDILRAQGVKLNTTKLVLLPNTLEEKSVHVKRVDSKSIVHLVVLTSGVFAYTIDAAAQKRIASQIAGNTRAAALEYLHHDPLLAGATIAVSPANAQIMPATPGNIRITVLPAQQPAS